MAVVVGYFVAASIAIAAALFAAGPNEEAGWSVAGIIVPIAYFAWSVWLIALGIGLIL